MRRVPLLALTLLAPTLHAQFTLQDAHTTADLRGIDNVGGGVAWASGSDGTILRTEDAGFVWQLCAKPPGGEHLDFRAIQAFDNNTAIIMSSGKGDQSRLYKTTDGCQTWKLVFTNPDKDGFWDALGVTPSINDKKTSHGRVLHHTLCILGDPVNGRFVLWEIRDPLKRGQRPKRLRWSPRAKNGETAFAASNSTLLPLSMPEWFPLPVGPDIGFGTGGKAGARWHRIGLTGSGPFEMSSIVPIGSRSATSGIFSVAFRNPRESFLASFFDFGQTPDDAIGVAVGGDFSKPNDTSANAAYTWDGGQHWEPAFAGSQPHGFRSAVAYDAKTNTWITVGPNGTDICNDDGGDWRALKPDPKLDTPDADQHWNALSLPYAVGPHGRIGTLRPSALRPSE